MGGGGAVSGSYAGSKSSPATGHGVQFSEEKNSKSIAPLSIGEGILGKERTPPMEIKKTEAELHLDKANSLLDEISREEKSGFKAQIGLSSNMGLAENISKKSSENYEDEFEEDIAEDIPMDEEEDTNVIARAIAESHGITVSASLGIDPSVDSLALEDYDHVEPVDKVNN